MQRQKQAWPTLAPVTEGSMQTKVQAVMMMMTVMVMLVPTITVWRHTLTFTNRLTP